MSNPNNIFSYIIGGAGCGTVWYEKNKYKKIYIKPREEAFPLSKSKGAMPWEPPKLKGEITKIYRIYEKIKNLYDTDEVVTLENVFDKLKGPNGIVKEITGKNGGIGYLTEKPNRRTGLYDKGIIILEGEEGFRDRNDINQIVINDNDDETDDDSQEQTVIEPIDKTNIVDDESQYEEPQDEAKKIINDIDYNFIKKIEKRIVLTDNKDNKDEEDEENEENVVDVVEQEQAEEYEEEDNEVSQINKSMDYKFIEKIEERIKLEQIEENILDNFKDYEDELTDELFNEKIRLLYEKRRKKEISENKFLLGKENINKENLDQHISANNIKNINKELYPSLDDKNFAFKIANKEEFENTRYDGKTYDLEKHSELLCNKTFEISPHQQFVKNFMSIQTPYNGLLLYHGL